MGLIAVFLGMGAIIWFSTVPHVMATYFASAPYSNHRAFPNSPYGGCDEFEGNRQCAIADFTNGMMNLWDYPLTGQGLESEVAWNDNPYWGNSPTAYYPIYPTSTVKWGDTYDAVGEIHQSSYPFEGGMDIGIMLLKCTETSVNCSSNSYHTEGLIGDSENELTDTVDFQSRDTYSNIKQEPDHLYVGIPIGYTYALAENCDNACYGAGFTDFGQNGNYMLVRNVYALPVY